MDRRLAAAVALVLSTTACADDNHVRLVVGRSLSDSREELTAGFSCLQSQGILQRPPLAERLSAMAVPELSLVVDVHPLGGFPDCRFTELGAWCQQAGHDCRPLASARRCFTADLPAGRIAPADAPTIVDAAIADLAGTLLTGDAPDGTVIVRLVGTTQSCAEIAASSSFDPDALIGCAHSCPAVLDDVHGDLLLSLEGATRSCEGAVRICASGDFDPDAAAGDASGGGTD